jgi:hypothetical protein
MHRKRLLTLSLFLSISLLTLSLQARTAIQNKGSDTLVNVAQAWAEAYSKKAPEVAIAVSGGGSGTGIAAMINGTVDIANASRKMKKKEIDLATQHGQTPVEHIVGYDALAVYIHPDNPAKSLSLDQLAKIYAAAISARAKTCERDCFKPQPPSPAPAGPSRAHPVLGHSRRCPYSRLLHKPYLDSPALPLAGAAPGLRFQTKDRWAPPE